MDLASWTPLGLALACVVGIVVIAIVLPILFQGLAGGAAIVTGVASLGCGSLFGGIIIIIVISLSCGFIAGQFAS